MLRYMFNRIARNVFQKYPKLSFLGGITIATTFSYFTFKYAKFEAGKLPIYPGSPFKSHLTKFHEPIINLPQQVALVTDKIAIKEFIATSPLYPNTPRTYEGFDVLEMLAAMKIDPTKNDLIIFEAKDGFKSHIPSKLILKYHPILAFRQKDGPQGQDWEKVEHPLNGETDGGPFYLMWPENTDGEVVDNHWAFGVVNISFGSFQKIFGSIAPVRSQDPRIHAGFKLFAQNCSCCHTFFNQGSANIGPAVETIVAKYAPGKIAVYAVAPPANSNMPKQELRADELSAIEDYIRFETANRLKP